MRCAAALLPPIAAPEAGDRGGLVGLKLADPLQSMEPAEGLQGGVDVPARLLRVAPVSQMDGWFVVALLRPITAPEAGDCEGCVGRKMADCLRDVKPVEGLSVDRPPQ